MSEFGCKLSLSRIPILSFLDLFSPWSTSCLALDTSFPLHPFGLFNLTAEPPSHLRSQVFMPPPRQPSTTQTRSPPRPLRCSLPKPSLLPSCPPHPLQLPSFPPTPTPAVLSPDTPTVQLSGATCSYPTPDPLDVPRLPQLFPCPRAVSGESRGSTGPRRGLQGGQQRGRLGVEEGARRSGAGGLLPNPGVTARAGPPRALG